MTTNSIHSLINSLVNWMIGAYLMWGLVVLYFWAWTDLPVVAALITALLAFGVVVATTQRRESRRTGFRQHAATRAQHYRQERLLRAEMYPDLVFEDNARQWEKEVTS